MSDDKKKKTINETEDDVKNNVKKDNNKEIKAVVKTEKKTEKVKKSKKTDDKLQIPDKLPVLILRDVVVFPYMIVPLYVGRQKSKRAVDLALNSDRLIVLMTQKDSQVEDPKVKDLYLTGTVALIVRMLKLPDGRMRVLVQGVSRVKVKTIKDNGKVVVSNLTVIEDKDPKRIALKHKALMKSAREKFTKISELGRQIPNEIYVILENIDEPGKMADIIASNLALRIEDSEKILGEQNSVKRLEKVYELLTKEVELLNMQNQINLKAQGEMDKNQKEYFLRQQLKAIQTELGEDSEIGDEINSYKEKLKKLKISDSGLEEINKNIDRLGKMHQDSAESNVIRNYLDWMFGLPWSKSGKDNNNIKRAESILNKDHFGLEKVKDRILEYLSVKKLNPKSHGPILCFVGPPGVGKTSLGRSIAKALNKKFVRISLGGVRDEAEIRGHRRTYVGAMPGKIIQELKKVGHNNPVFMMDEVDKIGKDVRGDPSSALLEVLDPEQNNSFADHYLGVPFDLSKVMFITTANLLEPIQPAFRDRMEIIQIHGYTEEEKIEIAKRHLIPRQIESNGLSNKTIKFSQGSIKNLIALYTREAGVRNLEREIGTVCRKVAHKVAKGEKKLFNITVNNLEKYSGYMKMFRDQMLEEDSVGVATGMAWTQVGGDILFIEVKLIPGKGNLILTGSLGNVMKESAKAALSYIKASTKDIKVKLADFNKYDIHIHIPEGGIPKDGPSAGITLITALYSAFTNIAIKREVSMTGELTLRGKVLPVGGIKEKILAAKRAGIKTIILPNKNRNDLKDLKDTYLKGINFHFAKEVKDAVDIALVKSIY